MRKILGHVVSGCLSEGFLIRLNCEIQKEAVKTGKFIAIKDGEYTFFSLITDLSLAVTHPDIFIFPPASNEKLLKTILQQKHIYITAQVRPMLMLTGGKTPGPVKIIPAHFSQVYEVERDEVKVIFGDEQNNVNRYFSIGTPLDMDVPICLDLERFIERSSGIFGKTGTGKTFLTRLVLAGLLKTNKAVSVIFDMHNEYGLQARKEEGSCFVKGLKTLFSGKIAIFSLDPDSTRRRGNIPDVAMHIPYHAISVEDILCLQTELNLHNTALEAAYLIEARYQEAWLEVLLSQGAALKDFAQNLGAHPESIAALYRKLKRLERFAFLGKNVCGTQKISVVDQMMEYIDRGVSIIIEFGNHTSTLCYLLIANIISRRIHQAYINKTEKFLNSQRQEDEPKKLMLVIEEAHKFLNPQAAQQTIFGIIAREMRKYYVSLLIIDQRPSGIDQEIISQIGTKIIAQLSDEKDIQAVLAGAGGNQGLKSIPQTLDTKKQVLIFGHAVAMPVVVQTRNYDENFYKEVASFFPEKNLDKLIQEVF